MRKAGLFYLIFFFNVIITFIPAFSAEIVVSKRGNDLFAGTRDKPVATLNQAIRIAREWRRLGDSRAKNGVKIIITSGNYLLEEPIQLRAEDSGTPTSPTIICADFGASVVFSGGRPIKNWHRLSTRPPGLPSNAGGKVWVANIDPNHRFRALWVNRNKAVKARSHDPDKLSRIIDWDFKQQSCLISNDLGVDWSRLQGMEMQINQWWAIANLRIEKAQIKGDQVLLHFKQPESRIQSQHPWPAPWISKETGNSAYFLSNSIQFLDKPGEWFHDVQNHKLYYWPLPNENLNTANVIYPFLETLVQLNGNLEKPLSNIQISGISFQHSNWNRPSLSGHVPLQAGMYLLDAYKLKIPGTPEKQNLENQAWVGRPPAALTLAYTKNVKIENCRFQHLYATGVDLQKGTENNSIEGNLFQDIGGSAILVGQFSDEFTEAHLPFNPNDEREICRQDEISKNIIHDVTNEDWGTVGIGAGYVSEVNINHNDISEVSYTGISLGWGWTKSANVMRNNRIQFNKIHHYGKYLYDVAGIYTLSAQPNSLISENYIDSIYRAPFAHLPDHWFYIYTDEGSSHITIKDNWTPSSKYLANANGPGNRWINNGNLVSIQVKSAAGVPKIYWELHSSSFQRKPSRQPINESPELRKSLAFELIFKPENLPVSSQFEQFLAENRISKDGVYSWQNRLLIYGLPELNLKLKEKLEFAFPKAELKIYEDIIYDFNRKKNCDKSFAKEWTNIILTANLVGNEVMQKEYLDHHQTQFEKWPELSKGFCNADFQQLLIYKNKRQLILVISIPKGKTLEELNPKTTENNPKVDEWNALMKKYQEGIPGTKEDEVWVFYKPISDLKK